MHLLPQLSDAAYEAEAVRKLDHTKPRTKTSEGKPTEEGMKLLIKTLRDSLAQEAPVRVNELFLDYFYSGQSWSKPNETMAQRIVRRETTFVWLKEASPETALSDNLKCMLLLIFSGLEPSILASVGDEYDYKKVSHVRVQFPTSLSFARTTCALAAAVSSSTEARWKQFPQRQKQVLAAEIDDEFHTGKMMTMPRRMTPTLAISTMRASSTKL